MLGSACSSAVGSVYDAVPTDLLFRPGWSRIPAVSADDSANQPGNAPISAPVLVVQGTRDSLVPYGATTALVDATLCRDQHDAVRLRARRGSQPQRCTGCRVSRSSSSGSPTASDRRAATDSCARYGDSDHFGLTSTRSDGEAVQTSRKRRTAKADPTTPTTTPTTATRMQVPATSHPPSDIWAMMFPWFAAVLVASRPIPQ